MTRIIGNLAKVFITTSLAVGAVGCANNAQNGALLGGAGGAGLGALIGSMSHARAGEGALIGGAVGALGGYIIGNEIDKNEQAQRERHYVERPYHYTPPSPPAYAPPPRHEYERMEFHYEETHP